MKNHVIGVLDERAYGQRGEVLGLASERDGRRAIRYAAGAGLGVDVDVVGMARREPADVEGRRSGAADIVVVGEQVAVSASAEAHLAAGNAADREGKRGGRDPVGRQEVGAPGGGGEGVPVIVSRIRVGSLSGVASNEEDLGLDIDDRRGLRGGAEQKGEREKLQIRARRERLRRALVRGALQAPPRLKFSKFRDTRTAAEATRKRRATSRWGEYTRIADWRVGGRPKPTGRGIARFRGPGARSASCSVSVRATGPEVAAALCRRRTRWPPRPRL